MTLISMAMEKHCTLENFRVSSVDADACTDWSLHRSCSGEIKENDNPDVEVLENLEDYFQDLNDRLIISRMVSDSVIKGMVGAVEQEAKEKIAQKELEISWLRSALRCFRNEKNDDLFLDIPETRGLSQVFSHDVFDVGDFLGSSQDEVMEQLDNLRKEIDGIKGPDSFWKINSGSQLVGIGGLLSEKVSDRWTIVDNVVNNLKNKLESMFHNLVNLDVYSKGSIHELQQERGFRAEVEASVLAKCIRGYQDESERKLWGCGNRPNGSVSTSKKMEEFRALQEELDALSKLLSVNDAGKLVTHGSHEAGEAFVVSSSDQNGKHDELVITMPENLDPAQLKHLPKDQLINYFKDEMIKMKRNHETKVQQMTEEVFSLKREYFKEKGIPLTLRKEKELDGLRRKIPEVMLKLEGILTEEKCVPDTYDGSEFLGILKERLEALQSENENLRNVVSLKRKEVKYLKSQVADAAKQLSSLSCAETNLLHTIRGLKSDGEDAQIEASISGDVYLSYLGDLSLTLAALNNPTSDRQKTDVEQQSTCPSECEEALCLAKSTNQWEIDHSEIESIILQGVHEVVFTACLNDAEENMNYLNNKLAKEVMYRITLESEGMEKEKLVRQGILENEKLREEKTKLATFLVQKERLAKEAMGALSSSKDQLQLLVININQMFDMISQLDQKVTSEVRINRSRLVSLVSEVSPLSEKFKMLRTVVLSYKHRLKTRTSNLEKAEAEVDLLGDQVDSLLRLLEKVYIALDHYSPILKHYPGIMEILKLVRKELCGESFKSVDVDLDDTPK